MELGSPGFAIPGGSAVVTVRNCLDKNKLYNFVIKYQDAILPDDAEFSDILHLDSFSLEASTLKHLLLFS